MFVSFAPGLPWRQQAGSWVLGPGGGVQSCLWDGAGPGRPGGLGCQGALAARGPEAGITTAAQRTVSSTFRLSDRDSQGPLQEESEKAERAK